jgi:hypothetical protein
MPNSSSSWAKATEEKERNNKAQRDDASNFLMVFLFFGRLAIGSAESNIKIIPSFPNALLPPQSAIGAKD